MAVDYKRFLAENVLSERRTVTYRLLSRALRVHCNLAKQMLYEFHRNENAKKPSSVNAVYVIAGAQKPPEPLPTNGTQAKDGGDDEDEIMQSSPYLPSSMPNQDAAADAVASTAIILVREDDLEEAKSTLQSIFWMHVYSLQPTVLQDLNVLTDASRELSTTYANEDPLEYGKQWGMIQNSHVKRRTGPPAPAVLATGPSQTAQKATVPAKRPSQKEQPAPRKEAKEEKEEKKEEIKKDQDSGSQPSKPKDTQPPAKSTERTVPKNEKNNIFSSFAKAKPKQKEEGSATPAVSGAESAEPSGAEDVALDDASEEEAEELFADQGKSKSTPPPDRETKKEREDRLKKMMEDDDDEEMPDAAELQEPQEPQEEAPTVDQPPPKQPELKEEVSVSGGRRRGKRQVMRKKTVRDEEGYLVTAEEPGWESFSEDEPAPKKKPAVSAPKNKPAAKAGQGNIMSFFGRK